MQFAARLVFILVILPLVPRALVAAQQAPAFGGPELWTPESLTPCDTWVALPAATRDGTTVFAKNSDRPLYDSQPLLVHPAQDWPDGARVELGRVSVPQVGHTYATLGSSPYWCWGFEEGVNEFGVAIGNEGIWSKALVADLAAHAAGDGPEPGPTGMDLLRFGLERGRTAREALGVITGLLEKYGQFGSGMPAIDVAQGAYENSFLIADPKEAWVLETMGRHWAARRVTGGSGSISNTRSIGRDFDAAWMMRIARDRSSEPSLDLDQTASSSVAVLPADAGALPVFWWTPATPSNGCYVPFFVHGSVLPEVVSSAGAVGRSIAAPRAVGPDSLAESSYWWQFRALCDEVRVDYAARNPIVRAALEHGDAQAAATILDAFSASCVTRALAAVRGLRKEFGGAPTDLPPEFRPLVGEYLVTIKKETVRVRVQEGRLALEIPGQGLFQLQDPDAAGRRAFVLSDQVAIRFDYDDFGAVMGMKLHQGGLAFELIRAGVVIPAEVPLEELQPYFGTFRSEKTGADLRVFVQNNRLAIDWPGRAIFELYPPRKDGAWAFRLGDTSAVRFEKDAAGKVA
ncbi:MAG TPA: C69 family dipeptidase, partial [Planctomycetota bacterium]